jgi:hypothetical protein
MSFPARRLAHATIISLVLTAALSVVEAPAIIHAAPPGASTYAPVAPYRILDTRDGTGFAQRRVNAGEAFTLALTGVPAGATAVVLNLTATDAADAGYVTVYPTGFARPNASSINVSGPGQTIANLVTVPVGAGNTVDIFAQPSVNLVADVQGYYMAASAAPGGRFTALNPTRLLDTREANSIKVGVLRAGEQVTINVAGLVPIPADATAAALKVTVTESTAAGFWTVFPADTAVPKASNLNVNGAGETIANQVLARLTGGRATIFSQSGGHVVVDLVGWFSGASTPASDVGLFVPVAPSRLLDSRLAPLGARPGFNRTAQVPVAGQFGLPASGIGAVVVNATITESAAGGFFALWPAQTYRPLASSLNASAAGQTIANHVITPVSGGGFAFFTQNGAHLVADITGWYTGTEVATVLPPHVPLTGVNGPPKTGNYAFSIHVGSQPVRWDPCRGPIRYAVNLGGYPEAERAAIGEAVERLEAATGLMFIAVGDTTDMPSDTARNPTGAYDMTIALGDVGQTAAVTGKVVGKTYNQYFTSMITASVVIDMGDVGKNPDWSSTGMGVVLLHELGHAVGMNHVGDATQVMNPAVSSNGPTTYGAGDLAGLWQLGAAQGCVG